MSLFTNPNLIDHIIREQGGSEYFENESQVALQGLVEAETRRLVEAALRLMRCDRRDTLNLDDIQQAVRRLGHTDILLAPAPYVEENGQAVKKDKVYASVEDLFREQLKSLGPAQFYKPQLKVSWIYIGGRIPSLNENMKLRTLSQMRHNRAHEQEEKRKLVNIIRDQPLSLLSREQLSYFYKVTELILSGSPVQLAVQGNVLTLMPFFMKFFLEVELNESAITFVLRLLDNQHVWKSLEYYLKNLLTLLLGYRGPQCFEVGMRIGQIVRTLQHKYTVLKDVFEGQKDESYATIMKKIAFELVTGIHLQMGANRLKECKEDAERNDPMAKLCMRYLLEYWSRIHCLCKILTDDGEGAFIYWHPIPAMADDLYLAIMY